MADDKKGLLKRMARNMLTMGRVLVSDMFTLDSPEFHHELVRALQATRIKRLNIIAPRDHAKSSLAACLLPLWHLFFEDIFRAEERERKFVVLVSKTQKEAIRRLRTLKEIIESDTFTSLFGDWGKSTAQVWSKTETILKDGSTIIAVGTGQQARGLKEGHQRPTLIVLDDPEDEENTKTVERMEQNLEWLLQGLEPALDPEGRLVVIGTPQHQRSMVMMLRDYEAWTTKHFKALKEGEDGELEALWPERYSVEQLLEKRDNLKAIGRVHVFYREYQCQITQGGDSPFRPEHFSYWDGYVEVDDDGPLTKHYLHVTHRGRGDDGTAIPLDEEEILPVTVQMGADPASSVSKNADYSVIVPVAITPDEDIYVLPYFQDRVDPMVHADQIMQHYRRFKPITTRIEQDGYQRMLKSYLQSDHFEERIPGLSLDTQAGKTKQSKEERHLGLQPLFAKGHIHIQPGMNAFFEEWTLFPDTTHDDLRDGFYYAVQRRRQPHHEADDREADEKHERPHWTKRDPMLA